MFCEPWICDEQSGTPIFSMFHNQITLLTHAMFPQQQDGIVPLLEISTQHKMTGPSIPSGNGCETMPMQDKEFVIPSRVIGECALTK
jgi:hypothetical protein